MDKPDYHWFASSIANWSCNNSLTKCLNSQRRVDRADSRLKILGCNVYRVPGDSKQHYGINHYAPEVEGTECIGFETY